MFLPFTNSACILVQPIHSLPGFPDRLICKLADRRTGERRVPWSVDLEEQFQKSLPMYIERTGGPKSTNMVFRMTIHSGYTSSTSGETWMTPADRTDGVRALTEAQALGLVPKYFGRVRIDMNVGTSIHPALDAIDGLLMEYIPGRLMSSIRPGRDISIVDISQRILNLARRPAATVSRITTSIPITSSYATGTMILFSSTGDARHFTPYTRKHLWMHHAMSTDFHRTYGKS
ncbi:hypothetical protein CPB85DRAFT_1436865 [Mucidula mucida]|nr:hypothetical protein CPB85DRAFT_1436865 [Mucidula mucida]